MAKIKTNKIDPNQVVRKNTISNENKKVIATPKFQDVGQTFNGDLEEAKRLGINLSGETLGSYDLYKNQSNWEVALNTASHATNKFIGMFASQIASWDPSAMKAGVEGALGIAIDAEETYTNDLSEWANKVMSDSEKNNPIYLREPGKVDFTSGAWWGTQTAEIAGIAGLALETLGETIAFTAATEGFGGVYEGLRVSAATAKTASIVGKMISGEAKMLETYKALKALKNAGKSLNKFAITYGVLSRLKENQMEAADTYKTTKDALIEDGFSEEEAKQGAGEAAAFNYRVNSLMLPLDIMQARLFATPFSSSGLEHAIGAKIKNSFLAGAANLALEGSSEAGEEMFQNWAQEEARYRANRKLKGDIDYSLGSRVWDTLKSDASISAGVTGFLGGVGMGLIGKGRALKASKQEKHLENELTQKIHSYSNEIVKELPKITKAFEAAKNEKDSHKKAKLTSKAYQMLYGASMGKLRDSVLFDMKYNKVGAEDSLFKKYMETLDTFTSADADTQNIIDSIKKKSKLIQDTMIKIGSNIKNPQLAYDMAITEINIGDHIKNGGKFKGKMVKALGMQAATFGGDTNIALKYIERARLKKLKDSYKDNPQVLDDIDNRIAQLDSSINDFKDINSTDKTTNKNLVKTQELAKLFEIDDVNKVVDSYLDSEIQAKFLTDKLKLMYSKPFQRKVSKGLLSKDYLEKNLQSQDDVDNFIKEYGHVVSKEEVQNIYNAIKSNQEKSAKVNKELAEKGIEPVKEVKKKFTTTIPTAIKPSQKVKDNDLSSIEEIKNSKLFSPNEEIPDNPSSNDYKEFEDTFEKARKYLSDKNGFEPSKDDYLALFEKMVERMDLPKEDKEKVYNKIKSALPIFVDNIGFDSLFDSFKESVDNLLSEKTEQKVINEKINKPEELSIEKKEEKNKEWNNDQYSKKRDNPAPAISYRAIVDDAVNSGQFEFISVNTALVGDSYTLTEDNDDSIEMVDYVALNKAIDKYDPLGENPRSGDELREIFYDNHLDPDASLKKEYMTTWGKFKEKYKDQPDVIKYNKPLRLNKNGKGIDAHYQIPGWYNRLNIADVGQNGESQESIIKRGRENTKKVRDGLEDGSITYLTIKEITPGTVRYNQERKNLQDVDDTAKVGILRGNNISINENGKTIELTPDQIVNYELLKYGVENDSVELRLFKVNKDGTKVYYGNLNTPTQLKENEKILNSINQTVELIKSFLKSKDKKSKKKLNKLGLIEDGDFSTSKFIEHLGQFIYIEALHNIDINSYVNSMSNTDIPIFKRVGGILIMAHKGTVVNMSDNSGNKLKQLDNLLELINREYEREQGNSGLRLNINLQGKEVTILNEKGEIEKIDMDTFNRSTITTKLEAKELPDGSKATVFQNTYYLATQSEIDNVEKLVEETEKVEIVKEEETKPLIEETQEIEKIEPVIENNIVEEDPITNLKEGEGVTFPHYVKSTTIFDNKTAKIFQDSLKPNFKLISHIVSSITSTVVSYYYNNPITNNLEEIDKRKKEILDNLKKQLEVQENLDLGRNVQFMGELAFMITHFDELTSDVNDNIKLILDGVKKEKDSQGKKVYSETSTLTENPHKSLSFELRRLFATTPKFVTTESGVKVKVDRWGIVEYPSMEKYYYEMLELLTKKGFSGNKWSNFKDFLNEEAPKKSEELGNAVKVILEKVEKSDQLKYAFQHHMNMEVNNPMFVLLSKNRNKYRYNLKFTGQHLYSEVLKERWQNQFIHSDIVSRAGNFDLNGIKNLQSNILELKKNLADEGMIKENKELTKSIFNSFGINLSQKTLDDLFSDKSGYKEPKDFGEKGIRNVSVPYKSAFSKNGWMYPIEAWTKSILIGLDRKLVIPINSKIRDGKIVLDDSEGNFTNPYLFNNFIASLEQLARIDSNYADVHSRKVRDNGKSIYGFTKMSNLSRTLLDIKNPNSLLSKRLKKSIFSSNSMWLELVGNDQHIADNIKRNTTGITAISVAGSKFGDKELGDLSPVEYLITALAFFTDKGVATKSEWKGFKVRMRNMFHFTASDKKLQNPLRVPTILLGENALNGGNVSDEILDATLSQTIYPELKRMMLTRVRNQKGFIPSVFYSIPGANTIEIRKIIAEAKNNLDLNDPNSSIEAVYQEILPTLRGILSKVISTEIIASKKLLEDNNAISSGLLNNQLQFYKGDNPIDHLLLDFVVNTLITAGNQSMVITQDMANYGKKFRGETSLDPLSDNPADVEEITNWLRNTVFANVGKRMTIMSAPNQSLAESEGKHFIQLYLEDRVAIADEVIKIAKLNGVELPNFDKFKENRTNLSKFEQENNTQAYNKLKKKQDKIVDKWKKILDANNLSALKDYLEIESTDAQELTTWRAALSIIMRQGVISKRKMDRLKSIQTQLEKGEELSDDDVSFFYSQTPIGQPQKPVTTGRYWNSNDNEFRAIYIKSSFFPLLPQMTKGFELDKLRTKMEEIESLASDGDPHNNLVKASYGTANKVGSPSKSVRIWDDDGNYLNNIDANKIIESIANDDTDSPALKLEQSMFGIQQTVPYKATKNKVSIGTQLEQVLFDGEVLSITDQVFSIEGLSMDLDELDVKIVDGKVNGEDLNKIFFHNKKQLIDLEVKNLLSELGVDKVEDIAKSPSILSKTIAIFKDDKNGLFDQQDLDIIDSIESIYDGDGNKVGEQLYYPLWLSVNSNRFEAMLHSIVTNRIAKMKMPGSKFVLGSEEGFKIQQKTLLGELKDGNLSKVVVTDKFIKQGGVLKQNQSLIPSKFLNQYGELIDLTSNGYSHIDEKTGLRVLNDGAITSEMMKNISFRTPTSAKLSGSGMEIVGFLPVSIGDLAIYGKGLMVQKGFDFDVDSETIYQEHHILEGGTIKSINDIGLTQSNLSLDGLGYSEEKALIDSILKTDIPIEFFDDKYISGEVPINSDNIEEAIKIITTRLEDYGVMNDALASLFEIGLKDNQSLFYGIVDLLTNGEVLNGSKLLKLLTILKKSSALTDSELEVYNYIKLKAKSSKKIENYLNREFKKKLLQNDRIRVYKAVYGTSNDKVQQNISQALTFQKYKDMADIIDSQSNKDEKNWSPFNFSYQSFKYLGASSAKQGVGIISLYVTATSSIQTVNYGKEDHEKIGFFNPITKKDIEAGKKHTLKSITPFEGYSSSGELAPRKTGHHFTTDVMGSLQNVVLDNETAQILQKVNMNDGDLLNFNGYMTLRGFDTVKVKVNGKEQEMDYSYLLINTPIIKKLYDKLKSKNISWIDNQYSEDIFNDTFMEVIKKELGYNNKKFQDWVENTYPKYVYGYNPTFNVKPNDLFSKIAGKETKLSNVDILLLFKVLHDESMKVSSLISKMNFKELGESSYKLNTKNNNFTDIIWNSDVRNSDSLIGKPLSIEEYELLEDNEKRDAIRLNKYTYVLPTTNLGVSYVNSLSLSNYWFSHLFPTHTRVFDSILSEFKRATGKNKVNSKNYQKLVDDLKKFIYSTNINPLLKGKNLSEVREDIYLDSETHDSLAGWMNKYLFLKKHNVTSLPLIKDLIPSVSDGYGVIKFRNSIGEDYENKERLTWYETLKASGDTEFPYKKNGKTYTYGELADDLLLYTLLNPVQSATEFIKFSKISNIDKATNGQIPAQLRDATNKILYNDFNHLIPGFIEQFILNNPGSVNELKTGKLITNLSKNKIQSVEIESDVPYFKVYDKRLPTSRRIRIFKKISKRIYTEITKPVISGIHFYDYEKALDTVTINEVSDVSAINNSEMETGMDIRKYMEKSKNPLLNLLATVDNNSSSFEINNDNENTYDLDTKTISISKQAINVGNGDNKLVAEYIHHLTADTLLNYFGQNDLSSIQDKIKSGVDLTINDFIGSRKEGLKRNSELELMKAMYGRYVNKLLKDPKKKEQFKQFLLNGANEYNEFYGTQSIVEFVSEIFSNKYLRTELANIKYKQGKTWLENFQDLIKKLIQTITGKKGTLLHSSLDTALNLIFSTNGVTETLENINELSKEIEEVEREIEGLDDDINQSKKIIGENIISEDPEFAKKLTNPDKNDVVGGNDKTPEPTNIKSSEELEKIEIYKSSNKGDYLISRRPNEPYIAIQSFEVGKDEHRLGFVVYDDSATLEKATITPYKYYGADYKIITDSDGIGVDVVGYKGKLNKKNKLLDKFNESKDDPQLQYKKPNNENQQVDNEVKSEHNFSYKGISIPTKFKLGEQQSDALKKAIDYVESNSNQDFYGIEGSAGTGKTTIIGYLQKYIEKKSNKSNFIYAAPTHFATANLALAIVELGNTKLPNTVASSFFSFMKNGKKITGFKKDILSRFKNNILIVDEVSMIEDGLLADLIEVSNRNDVKLILMGDKRQIPSPDSKSTGKDGNVVMNRMFGNTNNSILDKVYRQNTSDLLDNLTNSRDDVNITNKIETSNDGTIKLLDKREYNKQIIEDFKNDPDNSIFISFTNDKVKRFNTDMKEVLTGEQQLLVGDKILGYAGNNTKKISAGNIANSIPYKVTEISNNGAVITIHAESSLLKKLTDKGVKKIPNKSKSIYIQLNKSDSIVLDSITQEEMDKANKDFSSKLKDYYLRYQQNMSGDERRDLKEEINNYLGSRDFGGKYYFNPKTVRMEKSPSIQDGTTKSLFSTDKGLDYGYAITIHKSQGATIKKVYYDFNSVYVPNYLNKKIITKDGTIVNTVKNALNYVAMSRASESLVINKTDNNVEIIEKPPRKLNSPNEKVGDDLKSTIIDYATRIGVYVETTYKPESNFKTEFKDLLYKQVVTLNTANITKKDIVSGLLADPIIYSLKLDLINDLDQISENSFSVQYNDEFSLNYEKKDGKWIEILKIKDSETVIENVSEQSVVESYNLMKKLNYNGESKNKLYNNLLSELNSGIGKDILDQYLSNGLNMSDAQHKAIVKLIEMFIEKKIDRSKNKNLWNYLRNLLKEVNEKLRNLLLKKGVKVGKDLYDEMTVDDLSNLLVFSNNKIILPDHLFEYRTPDNKKFKTLKEARQHIVNIKKNLKLEFPLITKDNFKDKYFEIRVNDYEKGKNKEFNINYSYKKKGLKLENKKKTLSEKIDKFINSPNDMKRNLIDDIKKDYSMEIGFNEERDEFYEKHTFSDTRYITLKEAGDLYVKYLQDKLLEITNDIEELKKPNELEKFSKPFDFLKALDEFKMDNQEYEGTRKTIELWKLKNNIKYNPQEAYSKGKRFYSVIGAYASLDRELLLLNLLKNIENVNETDGNFTVSALIDNKDVNKNKYRLLNSNQSVYFEIYPKSEDILWVTSNDSYSGSVGQSTYSFDPLNRKETSPISYLKYPKEEYLSDVSPDINSVLKEEKDYDSDYSELGINLNPTNFRIKYKDAAPKVLKVLADKINKELDEKYGEIESIDESIDVPTLSKKTVKNLKYELMNLNRQKVIHGHITNPNIDFITSTQIAKIADNLKNNKRLNLQQKNLLYQIGIEDVFTLSNKSIIDEINEMYGNSYEKFIFATDANKIKKYNNKIDKVKDYVLDDIARTIYYERPLSNISYGYSIDYLDINKDELIKKVQRLKSKDDTNMSRHQLIEKYKNIIYSHFEELKLDEKKTPIITVDFSDKKKEIINLQTRLINDISPETSYKFISGKVTHNLNKRSFFKEKNDYILPDEFKYGDYLYNKLNGKYYEDGRETTFQEYYNEYIEKLKQEDNNKLCLF